MINYLRTICLTLLLSFGNSISLYSQTWHQQVDYQIDVRLDDKAHAVQARERVRYINHSPDTLRQIYFRVAWQGRAQQVSSKHSVYSVQQNGIAIDFQVHESKPDPAIPPPSLSQTLLEIQLSRPLLPGDSDVYTIAWQADIPIFSGGFGRNSPSGVDYTFTNWYPQVCVYDPLGWQLGSPFEADFSSEFGTFQVDLTLPKQYMVAATGMLQNAGTIGFGYENPGETVQPNYGLVHVWKFKADRVRDFAWATDPEWQHEKKQLRDSLVLHAFYFNNENQLASLETVLGNYEKVAFPYRHPQLSVVQMGELRAEIPMLVFAGSSVPHLDPAISWDFQDNLLKSTYLLRQFRYVMGDSAFQKGLEVIRKRYLYSRPPAAECIHLFERSAGLELDWLWEQQWNTRSQVDYAIESVQADGPDVTEIQLQRVRGTVLPLVLQVIFADGTLEQHYIPVNLLRAKLPDGFNAISQAVWPAADTKYIFKLPKPLGAIRSLVIDPQLLSGDVARENNRKDF